MWHLKGFKRCSQLALNWKWRKQIVPFCKATWKGYDKSLDEKMQRKATGRLFLGIWVIMSTAPIKMWCFTILTSQWPQNMLHGATKSHNSFLYVAFLVFHLNDFFPGVFLDLNRRVVFPGIFLVFDHNVFFLIFQTSLVCFKWTRED